MKETKIAAGHLLSVLTILIWGTTFISTKVLLRAFSPVEILVFRFLLGTIALCIACPHRLKVTDRKQEKYFIGAGICGVTIFFVGKHSAYLYLGLQRWHYYFRGAVFYRSICPLVFGRRTITSAIFHRIFCGNRRNLFDYV